VIAVADKMGFVSVTDGIDRIVFGFVDEGGVVELLYGG
jgi:hypothetical protein